MPTDFKGYDVREITHGTSYGAYAEILQDPDTQQIILGEPKSFTGLRAVSFETTQESTPLYADNVEHIRVTGAKTVEGSMTAYQLSKDFLPFLGKKITESGGYTDTGSYRPFVWQYIETVTDALGNNIEELHVFYNVKASSPTAEAVTDEDAVEGKEFEIPLTASPSTIVLDADGVPVTEFVIRKTEANASLFDTAYTTIVKPTDVVTP